MQVCLKYGLHEVDSDCGLHRPPEESGDPLHQKLNFIKIADNPTKSVSMESFGPPQWSKYCFLNVFSQ